LSWFHFIEKTGIDKVSRGEKDHGKGNGEGQKRTYEGDREGLYGAMKCLSENGGRKIRRKELFNITDYLASAFPAKELRQTDLGSLIAPSKKKEKAGQQRIGPQTGPTTGLM